MISGTEAQPPLGSQQNSPTSSDQNYTGRLFSHHFKWLKTRVSNIKQMYFPIDKMRL